MRTCAILLPRGFTWGRYRWGAAGPFLFPGILAAQPAAGRWLM